MMKTLLPLDILVVAANSQVENEIYTLHLNAGLVATRILESSLSFQLHVLKDSHCSLVKRQSQSADVIESFYCFRV